MTKIWVSCLFIVNCSLLYFLSQEVGNSKEEKKTELIIRFCRYVVVLCIKVEERRGGGGVELVDLVGGLEKIS